MEAIVFEILTKAAGVLVMIVGGVWWCSAGCPWVTITRVRK
jgi:polyferredoxin